MSDGHGDQPSPHNYGFDPRRRKPKDQIDPPDENPTKEPATEPTPTPEPEAVEEPEVVMSEGEFAGVKRRTAIKYLLIGGFGGMGGLAGSVKAGELLTTFTEPAPEPEPEPAPAEEEAPAYDYDWGGNYGLQGASWTDTGLLEVFFMEDHSVDGYGVKHVYESPDAPDVARGAAPPQGEAARIDVIGAIQRASETYPNPRFQFVAYTGSFGQGYTEIEGVIGRVPFEIPEERLPSGAIDG